MNHVYKRFEKGKKYGKNPLFSLQSYERLKLIKFDVLRLIKIFIVEKNSLIAKTL